jgi:hypothetical protein
MTPDVAMVTGNPPEVLLLLLVMIAAILVYKTRELMK